MLVTKSFIRIIFCSLTVMFCSFSFATGTNDFVMQINTELQGSITTQFIIRTNASLAYKYNVDCDVGNNNGYEGTNISGNYTCDYAALGLGAGKYLVGIEDAIGDLTGFPHANFNNNGDRRKIIDITQWGKLKWTSMAGSFRGADHMEVTATDIPDLALVTDMSSMFRFAFLANPDTTNWDVSGVTTFHSMFRNASAANPDTSNWVTTSAQIMNNMFWNASLANPDMSGWDVSGVTDMTQLTLNANLSTTNYDAALVNFSGQTLQNSVNLNVGSTIYCSAAAQSAKATIISGASWVIGDGGLCAPTVLPDLIVASDNGSSSTDNITSISLPDFNVKCSANSNTISLYSDTPVANTLIGSHVCSSSSIEVASVSTSLAVGNHAISYTDSNGIDVSLHSGILVVSIQAVPNTPSSAPDLTAATDDGVSSTDNITMIIKPDFGINCSKIGNTVTIYTDNPVANSVLATHSCLTVGTEIITVSNGMQNGIHHVAYTDENDFGPSTASPSLTMTVLDNPADDYVIVVDTSIAGNVGASTTTQFRIPIQGTGYNYNVDCDDENPGVNTAVGLTGNYTCNYASAGIYTIRISDNSLAQTGYPRSWFSGAGDKLKLLEIKQFGTGIWTSMEAAYAGTLNLKITATDTPNLSQVTTTEGMFAGSSGKPDISSWDLSNVTNMVQMFSFYEHGINYYDNLLVTLNGMTLQNNVTFGSSTDKYCSNAAQAARANLISSKTWIINDSGLCNVPFPTIAPDMTDATDLGVSNTDNMTFDHTPDFIVQCPQSVVIFDKVEIYTDNPLIDTLIGEKSCNSPDANTLTVTTMVDGMHNITYRHRSNGEFSGFSPALPVTIYTETVLPAPSLAPDLTTDSDYGISNTDNLTSLRRPDFNLECRGIQNTLHVYSNKPVANTEIATYTCNTIGAVVVTTALKLDFGSQNISYTEENSGGISPRSGNLSLTMQLDIADDFVIKVKTDNSNGSTISTTNFTIPTNTSLSGGYAYDYNVDCNNDGIDEITNHNDDYTCEYGVAGTYTIRIKDNKGNGSGFPYLDSTSFGEINKFISVEQWGRSKWLSMKKAFNGYPLLTISATDVPNLSLVTDASQMFAVSPLVNPDTTNWDTSTIQNMTSMFFVAESANPDVSQWDVSSVTSMASMFDRALVATPDTTTWDTSSVTNMSAMFAEAALANPVTTNWDTSKVVDMSAMFKRATLANPDTSLWDTSLVTDMTSMFEDATAATLSNSGIDTDSVVNISRMFTGATLANPDTSNWNTSKVTIMRNLFEKASAANPNTSNWNTMLVEDMSYMFYQATAANPDTNGWQTPNVTTMFSMFEGAINANPDTSNWDVSQVISMNRMFIGVTLPTIDYDNILIRFNNQNLQPNVVFSGGFSKFCSSAAILARTAMQNNDNWTISDGGICALPDPTLAPDLTDATDTGGSNSDNITSLITPDFDVKCSVAGNTVSLYSQQISIFNPIGSHLCVGSGIETITVTTQLTEGVHSIYYTDANNIDESGRSPALEVTVVLDPIPSAPTQAPDMTAQTDTGISDTDNFTANNTPDFLVNCGVIGNVINLYSDNPTFDTLIGQHTCTVFGAVTITVSTLLAGVQNISYSEESNGGESAKSPDLTVEIAVGADDFVITIQTDNTGTSSDTQFTIPVFTSASNTFNYNVDCNNDGVNEATALSDSYTCNYATAGTYTVRIKDNVGDRTGFPNIYFHYSGDRKKLLSIEQWGTGIWTSMSSAFMGATNLVVNAADVPDFSNVRSMTRMFNDAFVANPDTSLWNTSKVTSMEYMFFGASSANPNTVNWDTGFVLRMIGMFQDATAANPDTSNWDITKVFLMNAMFSGVTLPTADYDAMLIDFSNQVVKNDVIFDGGNSEFCSAEAQFARQKLIDTYNWTITDGGTTCASVNSAPSFTILCDIDATDVTGANNNVVNIANYLNNISVGPIDDNGQTYNFTMSLISDPSNIIDPSNFSISNSGAIDIAFNLVNSGIATFDVTMKDSGGVANSGVDSTTQQFNAFHFADLQLDPDLPMDIIYKNSMDPCR